METFFSLLLGGSMKLYDDLTDNNIITDDFRLQVLKTAQLVSLTAISVRDFWFSVFFLLMNVLCMFADTKAYLADNFYVSIMIVAPLLLIASFPHRESLNLISILYIMCFVSVFAIEPYITPEEYSYTKFALRSLAGVVVAVGLVIAKHIGVSWSFMKIGLGCLAYTIVSSVFQLYMLHRENETSPEVHA